jgi:hypothetical protein
MRNPFRTSAGEFLGWFCLGALLGLVFVRWRNCQLAWQQLRPAYAGPVPPVLSANGYPGQHRSLDATRADFLRRLDGVAFTLSEREVGFLENNIGRVCYS